MSMRNRHITLGQILDVLDQHRSDVVLGYEDDGTPVMMPNEIDAIRNEVIRIASVSETDESDLMCPWCDEQVFIDLSTMPA